MSLGIPESPNASALGPDYVFWLATGLPQLPWPHGTDRWPPVYEPGHRTARTALHGGHFLNDPVLSFRGGRGFFRRSSCAPSTSCYELTPQAGYELRGFSYTSAQLFRYMETRRKTEPCDCLRHVPRGQEKQERFRGQCAEWVG